MLLAARRVHLQHLLLLLHLLDAYHRGAFPAPLFRCLVLLR
jgi:hypothetical protein